MIPVSLFLLLVVLQLIQSYSTYTVEWRELLNAKCVIRANSRREYEIAQVNARVAEVDLGEAFILKADDKLYAVDEQIISTHTVESILLASEGTTATVPLFNELKILRGFARIEILSPKNVHLIPTDPHRERKLEMKKENAADDEEEKIREALRLDAENERREREKQKREEEAKIAREKQLEIQRKQQEERERVAYEVKAQQEAAARKAQEEADYLDSNGLTPTKHVPTKRRTGDAFKYEVRIEFDDKPTGINWDMSNSDQTVVQSIEPNSPVARLQLIQVNDILLSVNSIDVSSKKPIDTAIAFRKTKLPRLLIFQSPEKEQEADETEEPKTVYTLDCIHPLLIANVSFPVDFAQWSRPPDALTSCSRNWLQLSEPLTTCSSISTETNDAVLKKVWPADDLKTMFLSYRGQCTFPDKAKMAQHAEATGIIIVNNVDGEAKFPDIGQTIVNGVTIPAVMIGKSYGDLLMTILELEPAICTLRSAKAPCLYNSKVRDNIAALWKPHEAHLSPNEALPESSKLLVWKMVLPESESRQYITVDYIPATFGGNLTFAPYHASIAYPFFTACAKEGVKVKAKDGIVVVGRGECSFTEKAKIVQAMGAVGMIVVNTDDTPVPLMFTPGEDKGISIWVVNVGQKDGEQIEKVIESNGNRATYIKLNPT